MQSAISQLLSLFSDRWTEKAGSGVDLAACQPEIGESFFNYGRFARPIKNVNSGVNNRG
jgi:hypothetical protein